MTKQGFELVSQPSRGGRLRDGVASGLTLARGRVEGADGVGVGGVDVLGDQVRAEARDGVEDGPDDAVGLLGRAVGRGLKRVVPEVALGTVGGVARGRA